MKSIFTFYFVVFILCSCSSDDSVKSYYLSNYAKSLFPYDSELILEFKDQDGVSETANVTPYTIDLLLQERSNGSVNYENIENTYAFANYSLEVIPRIYKTKQRTAFILITKLNQAEYDILDTDNCGLFNGDSDDISLLLKDISVAEKSFSDVFVFDYCPDIDNSNIVRAIYSPDRGLEYVEFANGNYLIQQ